MQNSSMRCDSSAKSTQDHTMALSLPPCSCTLVPGMTAGGGGGGWGVRDAYAAGSGREPCHTAEGPGSGSQQPPSLLCS